MLSIFGMVLISGAFIFKSSSRLTSGSRAGSSSASTSSENSIGGGVLLSRIHRQARIALAIKAIIVSQAKRDWRDNVIVHREIKKRLDDLLFDFMEEHNLDWSLDTIDIIIDEILMVAKRSY